MSPTPDDRPRRPSRGPHKPRQFRSGPPRGASGPAARPARDAAAAGPAAPIAGRAEGVGTHWGGFASWYDELVGDAGSDYHQHVVLPGVIRLLHVHAGESVLDVACGQGVLCRLLHQKGCRVTGVDAAGELVRLAQERSDPAIAYHVADARDLSRLSDGPYDAATCVLAIQNIDPIQGVFDGVAAHLLPGGRFVLVMMHPSFRMPKHSHWGWDTRQRPEERGRTRVNPREAIQYRRVDRYLLTGKEPITVHPGADPTGRVWSFHRPLQHYVNAISASGLLIDRLEEWPSHRSSTSGPRADAENRARREIPLFLALRAVKR
jgi:ubiquinone/menaquinone biosynthesis C-methylase UbiE